MQPMFSIIIPIYNVAPYLCACLDSILAQTFIDWEAICVDDGSTDGSGAILDEYAVKDKRFRVFHKSNEGVAVARNFALDQVHGEYIGFIDGDDLVVRGLLDTIYGVTKQFPDLDWITMSGWFAIGNEVDVNLPREDTLGAVEIIEGHAVQPWGFNKIAHVGLMWLNYYHKDVFAHVRFKPGIRYGEDDIILLEALQYIKMAVSIEYRGYLYRIARPGAASRIVTINDVLILVENMHRVVRKYIECADDSIIKDSLRRAAAKFVDKFVFRAIWMKNEAHKEQESYLANAIAQLHRDVGIRYGDIKIYHSVCLWLTIRFKTLVGWKFVVFCVRLKGEIAILLRKLLKLR